MLNLNEQTLTEQPVIEWFKKLGYEYKFGPDISPGGVLVERDDFKKVLLEDRLRASLRRLNPSLIEKAIDEVIFKIKKINFSNVELTNKEFYQLLKNGVRIDVRDKEGNLKGEFAKVVDFENPLNNDFLVVNQFTVQGFEKIRRPDGVIFINGIPIAVFELKNPTIEEATIKEAFNQLQEYKKDIPEIFKYNQILVISDLVEAKYGTISSSFEWFKKWRGIDDPDEKSESICELEILVKGIFQRSRLLDIIKNFIVFEADSEKETSKYTKKICLYHQYFGVNKAILKTLEKIKPKGDGKIGIFWHTQGSGKTLSMVFYVNKIREIKELKSPTFLFLTDRNDLDGQFYKTFLRTGYQYLAKQASTIEDLRNKLKNPGNEIIFTTIQKFADINEVLSEKENFIVIADEAHRSQYTILAAKARKALPYASFMGITATPIENNDRNIRYVFGDYIDKYTISQSIADGATVKIYYEGRLVPLHLTNYFIDEEFEDLTQEVDYPIKETLKKKITKLESLIMADNRLEKIANDIVYHYNNRPIEGKAMVVTISRNVAVKMYQLIKKIPNSPEVAVVISNPQEFKDKIQKEIDNNELEKRFKNPDDPLKIVKEILKKYSLKDENVYSFFNELLVWRELSFNFVYFDKNYYNFKSIPFWAKKTLDDHKSDKRDYLYSFDDLEQGKTHDCYWNACQKEMVYFGKMANYMRMYWAKKLIEWTDNWQKAYDWLVKINNKYELDGRDPNGYLGVSWCFGNFDRPWFKRKIIGKVRYMSANGLENKFDIKKYVEKINKELNLRTKDLFHRQNLQRG